MTIVKNINLVLGHKFLRLGEDLRLALGEASKPRRSTVASWLPLEALLQVGRRPPAGLADLESAEFRRSIELFLGALHSDRFMAGKGTASYQRAQLILKPLTALCPGRGWDQIRLSTTHTYEDVAAWRDEFEALDLDPEAVWLWNGWGGSSKHGDGVSFPLYSFYERLGRSFTERLNVTLQGFVSGRTRNYLKGLSSFARFVAEYPGPISPLHFEDPYWTGIFFNDFAHYYFKRVNERGKNIRYAARAWTSQFLPAVEAMVESRLIAAPEPPIGVPRGGVVVGGRETRITQTACGMEVKSSCLTPIPLSLSDGAAKELLFRDLIDDFAAVVTWAEVEVDALWKRYRAGVEAAKTGNIRQPFSIGQGGSLISMTDPGNPDAFANCAATFWANGIDSSRVANAVYGKYGLVNIARDLGLPTPDSFLPHAALIVSNHCEVTTRFLSRLELFDKDGKRVGFQELDGGSYLVGYKPRKGDVLAEQRVLLNSRTEAVIRQVIELTAPLRKYLRDRNDDRWRFLFLAVSSIKAMPGLPSFDNLCSKPERYGVNGLDDSLTTCARMSKDQAVLLARNFSLRALRASSALVVYINTGSSLKMSEALGHTHYSPKLLDHYLPEPIQRFFKERWIRIFQTGLVCEAMKDSPLLIEAAGFQSMQQLDDFLNEHALRDIPKLNQPTGSQQPQRTAEIAIDVGEQMLTLLLSVSRAVASNAAVSNGRAVYWAEIGARVAKYLRTLTDRPDLLASLEAAERNASCEGILELMGE